jgi:hypothetical protein
MKGYTMIKGPYVSRDKLTSVKTKFAIHQTVYWPQYQEGTIDELYIEGIEIKVYPRYSGGGGMIGLAIDELYWGTCDDDKANRPGHGLYANKEDAQKQLDEYRERNPIHTCLKCGSIIQGKK